MKLRTSFFDKTVFRKDIIRFAPAWGIYLLGGLLVMLTMLGDRSSDGAAKALSSTIGPFAVINCIFALVNAQLLFGDLFNSRMCNALHALPLRRETWFGTHFAAGMAFSFVPHLIGVLFLLPGLRELWYIGLLWLLSMTMEYLFFFSVATVSVFLAGNRFAMAAVYAILNFLSMIVAWFIQTLYEPLLWGISISTRGFDTFSPVVKLASMSNPVAYERTAYGVEGTTWKFSHLETDDWTYLLVLTALGVAFLGVALLLYRRRALECAGDFLAEKKLNPVFSAVFTLVMAAVFQSFWELLFGNAAYIFFIAGLVMGFFGAQMLLERTVKVFRPKNFLRFGILAAALIASLLITKADPLGITRYIPPRDQVRAVELEGYTITDPEDIERAIHIHQQIIKTGEQSGANVRVSFYYELENGEVVSRSYVVTPQSTAGQLLKTEFFTRPEYVLDYTHWDRYVSGVEEIMIDGNPLEIKDGESYHPEYVRQLLEAIKADCEAGVMAQNWAYCQGEDTKEWRFVDIRYRTERGSVLYCSLRIYPEATNTTKWLNSHKGLWDGAEGFH